MSNSNMHNNTSNKSNRAYTRQWHNTEGSILVRFILVVAVVAAVAWMNTVVTAATADNNQQQQYVIIGVSGGLQKGFPDHSKLDYIDRHNHQHDQLHDDDNIIVKKAIFLGRALVRGYKSYLDVMESTHRQYISLNDNEQQQPLINSNVIPTGCYHHANEYWMYLVDSRQALNILMNEPRFLSITPDTGLVDLIADETSPLIKHVAHHEIKYQNKTDYSFAAFPIVTSVWYNPSSHIPSPILYTKEDGTEVTNFPQSLLKWIGLDLQVDITTCHADMESYIPDKDISTPNEITTYWTAVTNAIRNAEANRPPVNNNNNNNNADSPSALAASCTRKAQFGTSSQQARINYTFHPNVFQQILQTSDKYDIDYVNGKIITAVIASSLTSSSSS